MKRSAQTVIREGAYYTIAAANGRVLEVAGVSRWEDLPGTFVRVEESAWGTMVFRIGNILEDRWFDIREFLAPPAQATRKVSRLSLGW